MADKRALPTGVTRNYRRALFSVAKLAASSTVADQRAGWKVLLAFHALVAPPIPESERGVGVDRAKWIKGRVLLFRQGRWDELLASVPECTDADNEAPAQPNFYPIQSTPGQMLEMRTPPWSAVFRNHLF